MLMFRTRSKEREANPTSYERATPLGVDVTDGSGLSSYCSWSSWSTVE